MSLQVKLDLVEPSRRIINFNEELHRYTDEDNNVYTSVTQKLKTVERPFDTWGEAAKYARKYGHDAKYWVDEWARITKEACDNGNEKHNYLENGIDDFSGGRKLGSTAYTSTDVLNCIKNFKLSRAELEASPLKYMFPKIYARLVGYIERGWHLYTERIVYWYEYLVAGKIDLILTKPGTKQFVILDWKTNKDPLHETAGYYKKRHGIKTDEWVETNQRLLAPLTHLQDCKKVKYTLQLSMYAYLMELWGLICVRLELWHIRGGEEYMYEIEYLKEDAKKLLEYKGEIAKPKTNRYNLNNI